MKNYQPMFEEVRHEILARLTQLREDVDSVQLQHWPSPQSLRMAEWFKLLADLEEVQLPNNPNGF